jgi:hypothetical protein
VPTIQEIKRDYGEQQTRLINECFELAASAQMAESELSAATMDELGRDDVLRIRAVEGAKWAESDRQRIKTKYLELDLELRAAVDIRVEQIELALSPKNVSFTDLAAAATASPETLKATMSMALDGGDEDSALLAFQAGRQRDLDDVVAHAVDVNEAWGDLYGELMDAANDPELDPGDRFEMFAAKSPSRYDLYNKPNDINRAGMMKNG